MNSTSAKIKKFLSNRNTVTIVCAVIGIFVLWFGYNSRVNSAIKPRKIPYAKVTIQPRTKITDDMIGYISVPQAAVEGMGGDNLMLDVDNIINKYSNINTMIPEGSMFYKGAVVEKSELPDSSVYDVPEGETLYYLPVNMSTSYVNSIVPGGYIDLYIRTTDTTSRKARVGKFVENIKVLAVKTSDGLNVFENSDEVRTPAFVIFSIPEETHIYLLKVAELSLRVIPVPTNVNTEEVLPGKADMTSDELMAYINERAEEFEQSRAETPIMPPTDEENNGLNDDVDNVLDNTADIFG